ncbi:MAG: sodium ion-translocating decarboxylase subunit beta [Zestosphaera sp.]
MSVDLSLILPGLQLGDPVELSIRLLFLVWGFALLILGLKKIEPLLMIPLGIGMVLANAPALHLAKYVCESFTTSEFVSSGLSSVSGLVQVYNISTSAGPLIRVCVPESTALLAWVYHLIVRTEIGPILIFVGIGAISDFRPLLSYPVGALIGSAAQLGITVVTLIALTTGFFTLPESLAIGVVGGADGPTTIYTATNIAPNIIGPLTIAVYSYIALVPIIQPPIVRALVPRRIRGMKMPKPREVSSSEIIIFWFIVLLVIAFLVPAALPLVAALALGNIVKESGISEVVARYGKTIADPLLDTATILTMIGVGSTLSYDFLGQFVEVQTAEAYLAFVGKAFVILGLGLVAFAVSTVGGIAFAWLLNIVTKGKVNPVIGCAGVSAVPISARVAQREAQSVDPSTYVLFHALAPNVAGVIGTAIVAGYYISYVKYFYTP